MAYDQSLSLGLPKRTICTPNTALIFPNIPCQVGGMPEGKIRKSFQVGPFLRLVVCKQNKPALLTFERHHSHEVLYADHIAKWPEEGKGKERLGIFPLEGWVWKSGLGAMKTCKII